MSEEAYREALQRIKSITKTVPATTWTPEFREVANIAHDVLREHDYVRPVAQQDARAVPTSEDAGSNPAGATFCRHCGASIPHRTGEGRCAHCMEHLPAGEHPPWL